jgi:hypothetical protein
MEREGETSAVRMAMKLGVALDLRIFVAMENQSIFRTGTN